MLTRERVTNSVGELAASMEEEVDVDEVVDEVRGKTKWAAS